MKINKGKANFQKLRRLAEKRLRDRDAELAYMPSKDINELIHELDYYYLQPFNDDRSNDYSKRCLVFITIMIESISNEAKDIVETLFHETGFEIDNLPHFGTERYRNYMQNMDVGEDRQLKALLNNMHRSGFIELREADNFMRFLTPSHRFLQLSLDILEQHNKQTADNETKQWASLATRYSLVKLS